MADAAWERRGARAARQPRWRAIPIVFAALTLLLLATVYQAPHGVSGPALAAPSGPPAAVVAMRIGDHGDKTRFVLEITEPLEFRLFAKADPHRLVLDFPAVDWRARPADGAGLILGHEHAALGGGERRIMLALTAPARVRDVFYLPATPTTPYRFVLDLEPTDLVSFQAQLADPLAPPRARPTPAALKAPLPPPRPARRIVVIDPGHGGIDPGAIGVGGVQEKTLTLAVSRRLRDRLARDRRYKVLLTRDTDEFLRLRERVERARRAGAHLFVSIHADSIDNPRVRGASVYTLSDQASDRESAQLAARENRVDGLVPVAFDPQDDITASILIDLARRQTRNESGMFAGMLVEQLGRDTELLGKPHREAGFVVLTAPDVPSVLVELGYLSNRQDGVRLADPAHQERLSAAIGRAIDDFFEWQDDLRGS